MTSTSTSAFGTPRDISSIFRFPAASVFECMFSVVILSIHYLPSRPKLVAPVTKSSSISFTVATGENAGDVVQNVGSRYFIITEVLDEALFDDVDLFLGFIIDDAADEVFEFDGVFLVFEEFEFEGFEQAGVGVVLEPTAFDGQGADVVHDLLAEIIFPAVGDVDFFLDGAHQAFVGFFIAAGVLVADALLLGVGFHVFYIVCGEAFDGVFVGGDGALDFAFEDVFVFFADQAEKFLVAFLGFFIVDQRVVVEADFDFVEHHEGVDGFVFLGLVGDHRVGELVLDVAGGDAVHAFAVVFFHEFADGVFGVAGDGFSVVEFEFLEDGEAGFLGFGKAGEDAPHGGDFDGVGGDVDAADFVRAEVLQVNLDFVIEADVVGDVDLQRAVTEGFHEFVVLELAVFGFVGVADDDFVDVGLGEFLRLDGVFLGGAEEVVEEGDVEFEDFDEFDDAAVGDVEFAVEVEGAGVGIGAIHGNFSVVDVAGEFGGVLVLFVLGLERADAAAVFFAEGEAADADVVHDAGPVAGVFEEEVVEGFAAEGADVAVEADAAVFGEGFVEFGDDVFAGVAGDEEEGFFVHGARGPLELFAFFAVAFVFPGEGVEGAAVGAGVAFKAFFEEAGDGGFGGADGAVEEEDAFVGSEPLGGGFEDVDEAFEGFVEAEDGIAAVVDGVGEEVVLDDVGFEEGVFFKAVADDHVEDALEGVARDTGVFGDDIEVVVEGTVPVLVSELVLVEAAGDDFEEIG